MIKRILIIAAIVFLIGAPVSYAQTWHTADQITVEWAPATTLVDGNPVPAGDTVKYKVWLRNASTGGEPVVVAEVSTVEHTITLGVEGQFYVGVSALRYNSDETLLNESTVCWSDVVECTAEGTFGIQYFLPLEFTGGLKKK